jgi:hypothetical protein
MKPAILLILVITTAMVLAAETFASTRPVADLKTLANLVGETVEPGDVLELQPGTYFLEVDRIAIRRSGTPEQPIIIRGVMVDGRRPVIDASRVNVRRCVFNVGSGVHDLIFENLDICHAVGARFPDRPTFGVNATAIYFEDCHNITVRNCVSHHNEDGFFSTHDADYILIENCEIHHNGTAYTGNHNRTHNFYFCAKHQMVKNCYIHHATEGENFKSRGDQTIFAFNWVEEEAIYSVAVDSGGKLNTLWLGNVVMKRTNRAGGQGRLLGIGDGTGVASGTLVALNNTFVTTFPRDSHLFTERSATANAILLHNIFVGPGQRFLDHHGKGTVTGAGNWIANAVGSVPASLTNTLRGDDPGFVDMRNMDFRLRPDSPLISKGISSEEYSRAVRVVTVNARSGSPAKPSPAWLKALEEVERPASAFAPVKKSHGYQAQPAGIPFEPGAYQYAAPARQAAHGAQP